MLDVGRYRVTRQGSTPDAAQDGCVLGRPISLDRPADTHSDYVLGASALSLIGKCHACSGRGLGSGGAFWAPTLKHEHHSPGSRVTQSSKIRSPTASMVSLNGALEISSMLAAGASARVFVSSGLSVWTASSTHDRSSSTPATSAKSTKNCVAESASLEEPGSEPLQATAVKAIAVAPTRVRVARRFIQERLQLGVRGQVRSRTPIGNARLSDARTRARKRQLRERNGLHVILRSRPLHHRHRQRERAGGSPTYLPKPCTR